MKKFQHINASSIEEAITTLKDNEEKAKVIAGGTDLLGQMKDAILPEQPEIIVNIKSIPGLDYINVEGRTLKIGALTRLEDIATNEIVRRNVPMLAEAAGKTASPHIREQGTIAGNICQSNRCWYYWVPNNLFYCMRKGGRTCYAMIGDGRYHSIFGGTRVENTPCTADCLAGIDIPSYLSKIRDSDLYGAAAILLKFNAIPAITGRVCPHPCEGGCNRCHLDEPVAIQGIERSIGDYILEHADKLIKAPQKKNKKNVAVVGSGPAGLTAAYYLMKLGYGVTIFEAQKEAGGMLTYGIPSYRLPKDIVRKQVTALEKTGITFRTGVEIDKKAKLNKLMNDFEAVLLACGTWKERASGIKGDDLMRSGTGFLRDINMGIRKAPGKKVAVIGGGNVAIDVARTLRRLGAEPVIIYRRTKAEMPAVQEEVERAEAEGIAIQFLTLPVEVTNRGNKIVLTCTRMKLGPPDESGRPRPEPVAGSEFTTQFDAVMKALGEEADTSAVPGGLLIKKGQLKVDASGHFRGKNVFAGGDFVSGPSTVAGAMASGRKAAGVIDRYLGGNGLTSEDVIADVKAHATFNKDCLIKTSRAEMPEVAVMKRVKSLDVEDVGGLESREVKAEANRCLNCSCVAPNSSDIAPVLIALNATIKTTKRTISGDDFFSLAGDKTTVLEDDEIVTEIAIPKPKNGTKGVFSKFAIRKSIDFPIVNCAAAIESEEGKVKSARICLNSVYTMPYRATLAEEFLAGKPINNANAEKAAEAAVASACAVNDSKYKVQIAKTLVKRAILACK
jgi:NADPH-dependent glutamate synthase beta subunit-like oxidoreductase/CO/xanthine dehydrogenase FAD-binding subunit